MSDKLYLTCDCVGSAQVETFLSESTGSDNNKLCFRGKFQEAESKNINGRIYSKSILDREVIRLSDAVNNGRLVGELDHPSDSVIHFENASHKITKIWWDGNNLMGEGQILSTPAGEILQCLVKDGVPIGISSRGVGSGKTNDSGEMVIDENYKLITFDVVADPSTSNAYASPVKKENKQTNEHGAKTSDHNNSKEPNPKNHTKTEANLIDTTKNDNKKINYQAVIAFLKGSFQEKI